MGKYGVTDIDKGLADIIKELSKAAELEVTVGVQAGEPSEDGTDLAAIAAYNEFGTDGAIPERPFMRSSFDENLKMMENFTQDVGSKIIEKQISTEQGLNLIGQKMTGIIQKNIVDHSWTPNAPATIKQKGSDRPLIDTGRLRQSIRHVVKGKGDDK